MNIGPWFTMLGWTLIGCALVYIVVVLGQRTQRREARISLALVAGLVIGGLLLSTLGAGLVFINPEERGVVISALSGGGVRGGALQPGLQWIVPYLESVRRYPISRQAYTMSIVPAEGDLNRDDSILARTIDGQEVTIDATVIYAVDPAKVVDVHIKWQLRYAEGLVRPLVRGVIRDAIAQYKIEEVVSTQRTAMTQTISEEMTRRLGNEGIILVEFILRNITFSEEYAASVEQKQIAQQQAEQAKYLVQKQQQEAERMRVEAQGLRDAAITRAEGDAQSQVIRAKAEAEALKLISAALKDNPDLLSYRYIEKLSPNVEVMLMPSNDTGNPFIIDLKQALSEMPHSTTPVSPTTP